MVDSICCVLSDQGKHSFYLRAGGNKYYLFTQKYRKSVECYYGEGVPLDNAIDFGKSRRDNAIVRTMRKLPMYIRYVEKENGIAVLNKTKRQRVDIAKHKAMSIQAA